MRRAIVSCCGNGAVVVSILLVACALAPNSSSLAAEAARPNVVLVMTDDQGIGDLGVHGNDKIRTPQLDQFARQGVQLTRFYVNPVCAPTRASLLTGRYYYRTGVIHTSRGGALMHGDETTAAELLGQAGYRTGIFGKWHLGDNYPMRPEDQGFQESLVHRSGGITQTPDTEATYFKPVLYRNGKRQQPNGYCTDLFFDAAIDFIERHRDEPFFVYLATNAPHTPLEVDDKLVEPYRAMGLSDTTAKVYAMVENIDTNFGRLVAQLDKLKLRDNTLVIFLTDNGPQQERYTYNLRGRKTMTYEGGIHVPSFWQWPARLKGQRKIDRLAAHIDVLPTLLEVCGVQVRSDKPIDGISLWPLLTGDAVQWPDRTLYFQCHRGLQPKLFQNSAAVTERFKLVGYPGTFNRDDFEPSAEPVLELYDLQNDPGEQHNVADKYPRELAKLRAGYEAWFRDVESSRHFRPGSIYVGSDKENPVRLCYYQDGNWQGKSAPGWLVKVERAGRYRISRLGEERAAGTLRVAWNGKTHEQPIGGESGAAEIELAAGEGLLEIAFTPRKQGSPTQNANEPIGDVLIEWIDRNGGER
jgi:arylsulfatase A-like enzyme